ncbi:MAG TPA: chitinase [Candidatus Saccharimonadales bacterium]|nr:chitinase [Candidatus Saccharimonadales bacterium]
MRQLFILYAAIILFLGAGLATAIAQAGWPARFFAPYMYVGAGDYFKLTACDDACGQKFYTLAFIIADKSNNPAWDGRIPMNKNFYAGQIAAIRRRGGDVVISFGGEGGKELALLETNVALLQAKYQSVIDRYHFTWLDFDIEGRALGDTAANRRRNAALARIQAENPGLIISYTLPVDPNGISIDARKLLSDAKTKGLKIHSVNVMTMDFGPHFSAGKTMSSVSIASALKAYKQCRKIDPDIQIGLTPDIGQNDVKSEIFTLADARVLVHWAKAQPWVCTVSFWSSNRDNNRPDGKDNTRSGVPQTPWAYTRIFQAFGAP